METIQFQLRDESVRLCDLLKLTGIAGSGGQGKHLVAEGLVTVDGLPESRKTARIRAGQTIACRGVNVIVLAKSAQEQAWHPASPNSKSNSVFPKTFWKN